MRKKLLAACLACLALGGPTLHATTLYWSGDGTTQGGPGTWNTTLARWGTSTSGPFTTVWNNANTDSATIDNGTGAGGSIVIGAAITMRGTLTMNGSGGTSPAYTIDGSSTMTFAVGSTLTTAMNRSLNCPYSGTITKAGAGMVIFNNGNGSVTKFILNAGTADFSAPNRMPGTDAADFITFNGGKLRGSTVAWGSFGKSITVGASGGTIFGSSSSVAMTADKPITWTSSGNLSISSCQFTLSSTTSSGTGTLSLSTSTTCGAAGTIPSTVTVVMASGATLTLNGFDQSVKSISGTAGTVAVGAKTLTLNPVLGDSFTYSSVFTGTGKIVKAGAGTNILSGSSTGFTGEFDLNSGTVGVGGVNCFGGTGGTGLLVINGGRICNTSGSSRTMVIPLKIGGSFTYDDSLFAGPGQISFNSGAITLTAANPTITVNPAGYILPLGAVVGEDVAGRSFTKAGAGIVALNNAANTYSGDTTITAGTINVDADGSFGNGAGAINLAGGNIAITADRGVSSANITNPVSLSVNSEIQAATSTGTRNVVFGGVWTTTAGTLTLHNTQATVGPATLNVRFTNAFTFSQPITFAVDTAGNFVNLDIWNRADLGDQTYSGLISGPGSLKRSITTAGTGGKVTFTQQNTYSGGTSLNDGEIALGSDCTGAADAPTAGPLGTGTVTIGNDGGKLSASAGSRNLFNHILFSASGTHLTLLGTNDLELSGNVDLAGQSAGITNLNTGVARVSGVIGNGALTKAGSGTLVLSGANTYAGTTTVSAGLLDAAAAGSLGTSNVLVAGGAALRLDAVGAIGSSANLTLNSGTLPVNLNFAAVSTIRALSFDGGATLQELGTWGATDSGATHIDNTHFTGAGQLNVTFGGTSTILATDESPSTYGNSVTLTATVSPGAATGTVTFKDGTTALGTGTLSGGIATFVTNNLTVGSHSLTAEYAGSIAYNGSTSLAITQAVVQATPNVTAWPTASAITYGQALTSSTLTGGGNTPAGSFGWTAPGTAPDAGTSSQGVTFTPTDTTNYNTTNWTVSVTVNKATPSVTTWPTASAINSGHALSASTLTGGSASLPGGFAFAAPATVPPAGTNAQAVVFAPYAGTNYLSVTGMVNVVVTNIGPSTWAGGDTYAWTINQADGAAGANPGWDWRNITGTLTISATAGNPFLLNLATLTPPGNTAGPMANFNPAQGYSWKIATASLGITGFDPGSFTLDTAAVSNSLAGGVLAITQVSNDVVVVFSPAGNQPPTVPPFTAGTRQNESLAIRASKLLSRATDPNGDTLTITGVSPSTQGGTTTLGSGIVTYTPPGGFNGTDTFTYSIGDGRGGVATATVTVTVQPSSAVSLNITQPPTVEGGEFVVRFAGIPGCDYTIESTDSLSPALWLKKTNATAPVAPGGFGVGVFEFRESTGSAASRYYRTVYPAY